MDSEVIAPEETVAPPIDAVPVDNAPVDAAPKTIEAPPAEPAFDVTPFAEQFGFPASHFEGAQSVDDIVAKLTASPFDDLFDSDATDDPDPIDESAPNAVVESLRQQFADQTATIQSLQSQLQTNMQQQVADVRRRLDQEIDSWASPVLGVGWARTRTMKQLEASTKFRRHVLEFAQGLAASGQPIPKIEELARHLRVLAEPAAKPRPAKNAADAAPLGSPGVSRQGRIAAQNADQPRSIHHAYAQNATV